MFVKLIYVIKLIYMCYKLWLKLMNDMCFLLSVDILNCFYIGIKFIRLDF